MPFTLTFLFVIFIVISTLLQANNSKYKNILSPALTVFCGLLILYGAFIGNVPFQTGLVLSIAIFLLSMSDFSFERSQENPNLFPIAMVLGVLSGFTIGILLNIAAYNEGIPLWLLGILAVSGVVLTWFVYQYLAVEPALKTAVYIYLIQAIILQTGGLSSLYVGNYHFAIWGIFIFLSDTLVGIRAFPNPQKPIKWLNAQNILFLILVLYYSAQYALVSWAV